MIESRRWPVIVAVLCGSCSYDWEIHRDAGATDDSSTLTDPGDASSDESRGTDGDDAAETCSRGSALYVDLDGDGFGAGSATMTGCLAPLGYVDNADDCDDASADIHPGSPERCNEVDDDCSPETADGVSECNGFRCADGVCKVTCANSMDCATGLNCESGVCAGSSAAGELCPADAFCAARTCECANVDCTVHRCAVSRCRDCQFVNGSGSACSGDVDGVEHGLCTSPKLCAVGSCKGATMSPCVGDSDCASGSCAPSATCQSPLGPNGACNTGPDCAAGLSCLDGVCRASNGTPCEEDSACVSGSCLGVCRDPQAAGRACDSPADCAAGHTCSGGTCKLGAAQPCSSDAQCATNACVGTCREPAAAGGACDSPSDCQSGMTCLSAMCIKNIGQPCAADGECSSGSCGSVGACLNPGGLDTACNSAPDCIAGLSCSVTQRCKLTDGLACNADADCVSGACPPSRRCAPRGAPNAGCDTAADCVICAQCIQSLCKLGLTCRCNGNTECSSGYCELASHECCDGVSHICD